MGRALAARLRERGLHPFGVDPYLVETIAGDAAECAIDGGMRVFKNLAVAAASGIAVPSDVLIFVRMPDQVVDTLEQLDLNGFFDDVPVSVLSTLSPGDARGIQDRFGSGRAIAETPVSGGTSGARSGTLSALVWGRTGDWLEAAAGQVFRFDGPGQPAAAKLLNNLLAAANVHALAAVLVHSQALGLSAASLFDLVSASSGASWMTDQLETFPVDLLLKDLALLEAETTVTLPAFVGDSAFVELVDHARAALRDSR